MSYSDFQTSVRLDVVYHAPSEDTLPGDLATALRHAASEIERGETAGDTPRLHWQLKPMDVAKTTLRLERSV